MREWKKCDNIIGGLWDDIILIEMEIANERAEVLQNKLK